MTARAHTHTPRPGRAPLAPLRAHPSPAPPLPPLAAPLCLQVCLFDLDYGLPVQVRDTALGIEKDEIPESAVGKEFQLMEQVGGRAGQGWWGGVGV